MNQLTIQIALTSAASLIRVLQSLKICQIPIPSSTIFLQTAPQWDLAKRMQVVSVTLAIAKYFMYAILHLLSLMNVIGIE